MSNAQRRSKRVRTKSNSATTTKGSRGKRKKFQHGKGKKNFLINSGRKKK